MSDDRTPSSGENPASDQNDEFSSSTYSSQFPTAPPAAEENDPDVGPADAVTPGSETDWNATTVSTTPVAEPTVVLQDAPEAAVQTAPAYPGNAPQYAAEQAPRRRWGAGVLIVILALLAGLVGGAIGAAALDRFSGNGSNTAALVELPEGTIERVAADVLPSVVHISVGNASSGGNGTGIILSEDGLILTNHHVIELVEDGGDIVVSFSDGTRADASIVGSDWTTDLAVIRAAGVSDLQPARLGESESIQVGQQVVAIGSPFGLESTVTTGIVSALNRPVTSGGPDPEESTTWPAIQTDAAINPGNSGGPLVDLAGQVVGINTAIRTDSGRAGSIGLGFAIPIDLAKRVADLLADGQQVEHARIGIMVRAALADNQLVTTGAEIVEVTSGSAGDDAGLQEGDIITGLNDLPVVSGDALVAGIRQFQPGAEVELTVQRDGETITVAVTLGSDADD